MPYHLFNENDRELITILKAQLRKQKSIKKPARAKLEIFGRFIQELATLSKCEDRQVAAIAINKDGTQVYSIGINGGPAGGIDCLCSLGGKYSCIHAENQCISKCMTTDNQKIMICTLAPCVTCASLIVNSGFIAVYYIEDWKDITGLEILQKAGIACHKLENI